MRAALVLPTPGGPESSAAFTKGDCPLGTLSPAALLRRSSSCHVLSQLTRRLMWSAFPTRCSTDVGRYFSAQRLVESTALLGPSLAVIPRGGAAGGGVCISASSGSGSGCGAVTRIMSSRSSSSIIGVLSSRAFLVLLPSNGAPVLGSRPSRRKLVFPLTEVVTLPPYFFISCSTSSRSSESCVPVTTNVFFARQSGLPTGTRLLPLLGGRSSFMPGNHLRGGGGAGEDDAGSDGDDSACS
mmetsp:Transcript_13404/g.22280  ORF Transcript_13404/g.22280 Transcript_13404/m.22280 type:complete len:241 (-) Transcript_13404:805-1527(-)